MPRTESHSSGARVGSQPRRSQPDTERVAKEASTHDAATLRQRKSRGHTDEASRVSPMSESHEESLLECTFRFLDEEADEAPASPLSHHAAQRSSDDSTSRRGGVSYLLILCILFALLLRVLIGGGGYSGRGVPPMFGDYEAQRHWMEVTLHLPTDEWYRNTSRNDLSYWGLDYPPLTAYVSLAFGHLAQMVGEADLVALGTSHGYETSSSKHFMRLTVLACDALLFLPAVLLAMRAMHGGARESRWRSALLSFLVWTCPPFLLIDHGHFQYNCFSLGLVAYAVWLHWRGRDRLGGAAFVLALAFKQMSLYYAPAFFAYLLARTRVGRGGKTVAITNTLTRLVLLGSVVIGTFALCFLPFLVSLDSLSQVFHRMFPFARGLYEDKVANFWCATSIVIKWHLWFPRERMVQASLACTLAAIMPACVHVYRFPSRRSFLYTLAACAFSFFLFSFQVHEKTILLPMLPVALMAGQHPLLFAWMTAIATFSMYPLLEKDGHALTYAVLQVFFILLSMSYARAQLRRDDDDQAAPDGATDEPASTIAAAIVRAVNHRATTAYRLVQVSLLGAAVLHLVYQFAPRSARYPDLLTMLIVIYATAHFIFFYAVVNVNQWAISRRETEDESLHRAQETTTARAKKS